MGLEGEETQIGRALTDLYVKRVPKLSSHFTTVYRSGLDQLERLDWVLGVVVFVVVLFAEPVWGHSTFYWTSTVISSVRGPTASTDKSKRHCH